MPQMGRCPLCVAASARHTVHVDGVPPPNLYQVEEFWDEEGKQHMHDSQRRVMHQRCSNDHHWNVTFLSRCPAKGCAWNLQEEVREGVGWPIPPEGPGDGPHPRP